ncbi:ribonuclease HIII [Akkermansiaceae bacterium]|nr:ribonuclease HIII [Akkermansiaceae bacterium]
MKDIRANENRVLGIRGKGVRASPRMAKVTYTLALSDEQVTILKACLLRDGFEFKEKEHVLYSAKRGKLNVTVYRKGPKVLVQGKETEDFVKFVLEPEVVGEARLGYEEHWQAEMFEPHFGIDESGKGDYFGPLIVAGVYTNSEITRALMNAGIMDSKRIGSGNRVRELAGKIRAEVGNRYKVIRWAPSRYNLLYKEYNNVNLMLARGHATVIKDLSVRVPSCGRALSDQFTKAPLIARELKNRGVRLNLEERTKAENDIAVAAASILARESFLDWMDKVSRKIGLELPFGAGSAVKEVARKFIQKFGKEKLGEVVKLHFKTTDEI